MRIAFLGKGGAGKTTTAAGFVKYAAKKHPFVLAIDADVNAHLKSALSFSGEAKQLGLHFDEITEFLRGTREDLGTRPIIGTTPPSIKSNFITVKENDPFVSKYGLKQGNVTLLTVGTYQQEDVGGSCYHEKLKSLAGIFHHTLDTDNDIVIADTTAGTDNVATSLSFAYDLNVFVLEPTEKSVQVYIDYKAIAGDLAERTYVIGNKVDGEEDAAFIQGLVGKDRYLGSIPFSRNLKCFEQGEEEAIEEFHGEQAVAFEELHKRLVAAKRDWNQYLERLRATYKWDCQRWYSDFYGCNMEEGVDQSFTYQQALAKWCQEKQPALV